MPVDVDATQGFVSHNLFSFTNRSHLYAQPYILNQTRRHVACPCPPFRSVGPMSERFRTREREIRGDQPVRSEDEQHILLLVLRIFLLPTHSHPPKQDEELTSTSLFSP